MPHLAKKRFENVAGDFFVDSTCIDCDTCRSMAPGVFHRAGDMSAVFRQPENTEQRLKAHQALVSCPTGSIGNQAKDCGSGSRSAQKTFPLLVSENVYDCGFRSESSFGATSYLIQRPEGNILVDSPRFVSSLVKRLEALGGVQTMFLTHIDDVADHKKYRDHFGCDRILHKWELDDQTKDVEMILEGDQPISLDQETLILPVPGHTRGHCVLLYKNKFLFTGDHMSYSPALKGLSASRDYCWYSWDELIRSTERLSHYDWEWVLPGHGRRLHAPQKAMRAHMAVCLKRMALLPAKDI